MIDSYAVKRMRKSAKWFASPAARAEYRDDSRESLLRLSETCERVANRVAAALKKRDQSAAEHEAGQWPDEAGSWK